MRQYIRLLLPLSFLVFILSCKTKQQTMQAELVLDAKAKLGEGAIWHPDEKRFYWIDIEGKVFHVFNPASGEDAEHPLPERVGTVVPVKAGGVLLAMQNGIHKFDFGTGSLQLITHPEIDKPGNRFNDGKCDPAGRLWVGTMSTTNEKNAGALYCLDTDKTIDKKKDKVGISNGIAWSPEGTTMYYIDTPTGKVEAFDFDVKTGEISNPRYVIEVAKELGHPDGSTMDSEGMLWIALWGGSCVTRWNPETGKLLQKIDVPARNVTSCAFGGENLEILYITTARIGTDDEDLKKFPNAGGVFAVKPGVKGLPAFFYTGSFD